MGNFVQPSATDTATSTTVCDCSTMTERPTGRLITADHVYSLTYRQLQQMAKIRHIPSNIKKMHLQEALISSYRGNNKQVHTILEQVKKERMARSKRIKTTKRTKKWDHIKYLLPSLSALDRLKFARELSVKLVNGQPAQVRTVTNKPTQTGHVNYVAVVAKKNMKPRKEIAVPKSSRVLRNKKYSRVGQTARKIEASKDIVSSSIDVAPSSLVHTMLDRVEYRADHVRNVPKNILKYQIRNPDEPIDFSVTKYHEPNIQEYQHTYSRQYRAAQSVIMYKQVSNRDYTQQSQMDVENTEMTLYAQTKYQNHGFGENYTYNYSYGYSQEVQEHNRREPEENLPYYHKKIRIDRRNDPYEYCDPNNNVCTVTNKPDSTVEDDNHSGLTNESDSRSEVYEYMTNVEPFVRESESVDYTDMHQKHVVPMDYYDITEPYNAVPSDYYNKTEPHNAIRIDEYNKTTPHSAVPSEYNNKTAPHIAVTSDYYNNTEPHNTVPLDYYNKTEPHNAVPLDYYNKTAPHNTVPLDYYSKTAPHSAVPVDHYNKTAQQYAVTDYNDKVAVDYNKNVVRHNENRNYEYEYRNAENVYEHVNLPPIMEAFPKFCKSTQTYAIPLYVHIDGAEDVIPRIQTCQAEDNLLKISKISQLTQTEDMSQPAKSEDLSLQEDDAVVVVGELETILTDSPQDSDLTELEAGGPWSDVGAAVTVRTASPYWEDVLALIGQEEDNTDRVGSIQCVCCDWNGESHLMEAHIREEHVDDITTYTAKIECKHSFSLGSLLRQRRRSVLLQWSGKLLALLVAYEEPEWLAANVAMLSPHGDSPFIESSITIYNKVTGEPFSWNGPVLKSNIILYSNPTAHLKVQMSKLGLVPNSADVLLWNGQLQTTSDSKSICGNVALDDVFIDIHLELSC